LPAAGRRSKLHKQEEEHNTQEAQRGTCGDKKTPGGEQEGTESGGGGKGTEKILSIARIFLPDGAGSNKELSSNSVCCVHYFLRAGIVRVYFFSLPGMKP